MNTVQYYSLNKNDLFQLVRFVVKENYNHHTSEKHQYQDEIKAVYDEEAMLKDSKIFISTQTNHSIIGTIRVVKWNRIDSLPIKKLFGINVARLTNDMDAQIWHIGRFAIKKGVDRAGFQVFKTLMVCAINEVCQNENSFALAECDIKLLRILKLLGIEATTLAEPIDYLGSKTIAVLLPFAGLKRFLDQNYHLLPKTIVPLRHFRKTTLKYSFRKYSFHKALEKLH